MNHYRLPSTNAHNKTSVKRILLRDFIATEVLSFGDNDFRTAAILVASRPPGTTVNSNTIRPKGKRVTKPKQATHKSGAHEAEDVHTVRTKRTQRVERKARLKKGKINPPRLHLCVVDTGGSTICIAVVLPRRGYSSTTDTSRNNTYQNKRE